MRRLSICLFCLLSIVVARGQQLTTVDIRNRLQTHEGWGVSLCWWANVCGHWTDEAKLDTMLTWLCSPDHLNYSLFRYNIGGGDDPCWTHCEPHHNGAQGGKGLRAEMPGFKTSADANYDWAADSAQTRVLLRLKQLRADARVEAFSNSAPYYMTVSGCVGGAEPATADNVAPEQYEAFATYLLDVCKEYKQRYGIEFLTLEPFNEPETDYWYRNGSQEGCHFAPESQIAFLKVLGPMLKQSGLRTMISASDETNVGQGLRTLEAYAADGEVLDYVGQWNVHTYGGNNRERVELQRLTDSLGLRLWQSETGSGGRGLEGNLRMAQRLIDDERYLRPLAWMDWQYVEEHGDQWCLLRSDWQKGVEKFERLKNYYVRYQFTHFIGRGYTFVETDCEQMLCAIAPNGKELVVVVLNAAAEPAEHIIELASFAEGGEVEVEAWRTSESENAEKTGDFALSGSGLSATLPPMSLTTFRLRR